ncbi:S8 family serine peptidase [Novosphingobium sp. KCTC 2891]|uniref:S8 family serine peptidase n=1 Tax=Novosphingobium sp. KCTC 2891 TaxID=2989730 RepID=UPI0022233E41|nr:S8 family serine peptidase [Novosphingobium sp. KCTC 2891]MCW1381415.1 S8 family serine peptidase [Novosphingobium sp. KCTC 2891]
MRKIVVAASVAACALAGAVLAAGAGGGAGSAAAGLVTLATGGNTAAATPQAKATTGTGRLIAAAAGKGIPDSYICVFGKGEVAPTAARGAADKAVRSAGGRLGHVYDAALQGFSVTLPAQAAQVLLEKNPNIAWCEQDQVAEMIRPITATAKPGGGGGGSGGETKPWGITAVLGGQTYGGSGRAYVIDTGIDLTHPDLNVDTANSRNYVSRETSPQDLNGHGTHVAGTIGAKGGNGIGVVGVAAGAPVVAVRVLDRRGSGAYSDVIAGVNYVAGAGKAGDVANMSLGGPASDALDAAVCGAATNVRFAIAAGNDGASATNYSPARVTCTNTFIVAAMTEAFGWASFSNYGQPPVDYIEPGVNVLSTWLNGGYNTISGTSMATPHMAGLLLAGPVNNGGTVTRVAGDNYVIGKH